MPRGNPLRTDTRNLRHDTGSRSLFHPGGFAPEAQLISESAVSIRSAAFHPAATFRTGITLAVLILLACATCEAGDEIVYKGYSVRTWPRAEQLEALRLMAGDRGKVIEDRLSGKLLVLATTNAHALVAALLADVDMPARNVRIDITTVQAGTASKSGFEVQGSGRISATRDGTAYKIRVKPVVIDESSGMNSLTRQTILVANGCEGSVAVAREVPHVEWLWDIGRRWGCVPRDMIMHEVGAFLTVQPFVTGDGQLIRMKLTPELRGLVGGKQVRIQFTRVSTEVTVRNGASFPIAGLGQDEQFTSRFLAGVNHEGMTSSLQMTVTPRILGADGMDVPR